MTTITTIRVTDLPDGRCSAHVSPPNSPPSVGAESSEAGLRDGRDPVAEAVENLRRLYPDLPEMPVERFARDGMTRIK